jgi:hypothetical protein
MRSRWGWAALLAAVGAAFCAGNVLATPAVGVTTMLYGPGALDAVNLTARASVPDSWNARIRTHGLSDVYVADNTYVPGGTSGWHTHPGPSVILVVSGTVTNYVGSDPSCTPHVYTAGQSYTDPGGKSVHMIRNEGTVEARTIAFQILPRGATRRIDEPEPVTCHL